MFRELLNDGTASDTLQFVSEVIAGAHDDVRPETWSNPIKKMMKFLFMYTQPNCSQPMSLSKVAQLPDGVGGQVLQYVESDHARMIKDEKMQMFAKMTIGVVAKFERDVQMMMEIARLEDCKIAANSELEALRSIVDVDEKWAITRLMYFSDANVWKYISKSKKHNPMLGWWVNNKTHLHADEDNVDESVYESSDSDSLFDTSDDDDVDESVDESSDGDSLFDTSDDDGDA